MDCKYGTTENSVALAEQETRSHMGDLRRRLRNHQQRDIYPAERFQYDERRDTSKYPAAASFNGITSIAIAVTMTIERDPESAAGACWPRNARAPKRAAASIEYSRPDASLRG